MAQYPLSPSYNTQDIPRPLLSRRGDGDGRVSQLAALAAAFRTSIKRGSFKCFKRYSTGSAFTAAATSSMNDSCANVFCNRSGDRNGPVKKGDGTLCTSTR